MASSIEADTDAYEAWLHQQCDVVEPDLVAKHEKMRKNPFKFLRATFYRWARQIEAICPDLADAPAVLSVGDTHLENFGTWRDQEGRLVWGINDFDEVAVIPYAYDLVRLMASARLGPETGIALRDAAGAILEGYGTGLADPRPTLLDEQEMWMRPLVALSDRARQEFWDEVDLYPAGNPPADAAAGLLQSLPAGAAIKRYATRSKGGGGLGRPRHVAVADWRGGRVVREAKALVPSAWEWAHGRAAAGSRFMSLATGRFRSPDPFLAVHGRFIIRRIAADARKVDVEDLAGEPTRALLEAMGLDLGAAHADDSAGAAAIRADLDTRPDDWLHKAAKDAAAAVEADHAAWKATTG